MTTPEKTIATRVIAWQAKSGRHNLPWQNNPTPYRVWISEIMLQQTQVDAVKPYFLRFLKSFPDIRTLAASDLDDVLANWSGLGYYARARNLYKTANILVSDYKATLPSTVDSLEALPGIGRSTAGAIVSIAFQKRAAILDANVKRVIARLHTVSGWPGHTKTKNHLWELAESCLPASNFRQYSQAMMDLGALICTSKKPNCRKCPLRNSCIAAKNGRPEDYPGKKPKKAIQQKKTTFLVLLNNEQQVLIYRRPARGIWGGLWCLPEARSEQPKEIENILSAYGINNFSVTCKLPTLKHTFTHFQLQIQPLVLHIPISVEQENPTVNSHWLAKSEYHKYGIPVPVKKLLDSLGFSSQDC